MCEEPAKQTSAGPAAAAPAAGPLAVDLGGKNAHKALLWLETSLKRVFPNSPPGARRSLEIVAARNRSVSFQACLRNEATEPLKVACSVAGTSDVQTRVRRVGYVPMWHVTAGVPLEETDGVGHLPGLVPEPLYPDATATVGPMENQSFWITLTIPADAQPGRRELTVTWSSTDGGKSAELKASLDVKPLVVQKRKGLPVTHWWRAESIYEHYKIEPFGEKWFEMVRPYLLDLTSHGNDVIFVPMIAVRREQMQRPAQLLLVDEPEPGKYAFDFVRVRRFVKLARECGAEAFEWPHLWIYWGVRHPMLVYKNIQAKPELLWPPDLDGHSDKYYNFLRQYLDAWHKFLLEERLLDISYFHLSDEPGAEHIENYKKARKFLKETAPWMKVLDALSDLEYGRQGITDHPVVIASAAKAYIDAGVPHWMYICCGPRGEYVNRFMDTPMPKIRMLGWLMYRLGAQGYLHWGYNCWQRIERDEMVDPYTEGAAGDWPGLPYGDPFVVYPGADGKPVDSARWEVFWESLQDYAMLQSAGVKPDDPRLAPLKTYGDFPKSEEWIDAAVRSVLEDGAKAK